MAAALLVLVLVPLVTAPVDPPGTWRIANQTARCYPQVGIVEVSGDAVYENASYALPANARRTATLVVHVFINNTDLWADTFDAVIGPVENFWVRDLPWGVFHCQWGGSGPPINILARIVVVSVRYR